VGKACERNEGRVALLMAESFLLDTHAPLWWLVEPEKLSSLAHAAIHNPASSIVVNAATGAADCVLDRGWPPSPAACSGEPSASEWLMVVPQVGSRPKRVLDAQPFDALAVLQVFAE
jgi:hypothetical protein